MLKGQGVNATVADRGRIRKVPEVAHEGACEYHQAPHQACSAAGQTVAKSLRQLGEYKGLPEELQLSPHPQEQTNLQYEQWETIRCAKGAWAAKDFQ